jgi:hypothetical protein
VSREGRLWDGLAQEAVPCLQDVDEGRLLDECGFLNIREVMQSTSLASTRCQTWTDHEVTELVALVEIISWSHGGEAKVWYSAMGLMKSGTDGNMDNGDWALIWSGPAERPSCEWVYSGALRGSREEVMDSDRYRDLRVSVQMGQKGTGRLTSFLRTDQDWVVGGPSQWSIDELTEEDREDVPEGSFWVRSAEPFKIHSTLFCRHESPACHVDLMVVPTDDGRGLDDPEKTWGVRLSPIVRYLHLLFLVEQRHKVLRVLKHLLR